VGFCGFFCGICGFLWVFEKNKKLRDFFGDFLSR